MTAAYIIKSIKEAGHRCVASDIDATCFGRYLADDFILMPRNDATDLWATIESLLIENRIDAVIPSLDETLLGWAHRQDHFRSLGIHVILSGPKTVSVCQDKWLTYNFFVKHGIPTPSTSLLQEHPLVKPRLGRGGVGVKVTSDAIDMTGMVSQELLQGVEYTVDVFCDRDSLPVYIVPRRRIGVRDGKSTGGVVEDVTAITQWVTTICSKLCFVGPINVQCFLLESGDISFVEINPRIAGGMALGFAATENWIGLAIDNIIHGRKILPVPVHYGLAMKRYYAELFVPTC
jgi:carbamoyl-phosphate synthase large subunit